MGRRMVMSDKEDETSKMDDCFCEKSSYLGDDILVEKVGEYMVEIAYDQDSEKTVDDRIAQLADLYLQNWG